MSTSAKARPCHRAARTCLEADQIGYGMLQHFAVTSVLQSVYLSGILQPWLTENLHVQ